jgi:hypothetical protein
VSLVEQVNVTHHTLGVDIPESDSSKLATLEGCVEHLASRVDTPPHKESAR